MHSRIIQVSTTPLKPEEFRTEEFYHDDAEVLRHCDYIGYRDSDERRKEMIESFIQTFSEFIESYDLEKSCAILKPIGERQAAYSSWIKDGLKKAEEIIKGRIRYMTHYKITSLFNEYQSSWWLVHYDGCTMETGYFACELCMLDDDRIYFGSSVDFHI